MQISMWVPYDEGQLRRTVKVVLRPQVRLLRILGAVLIVLALLVIAVGASIAVAAIALILGVLSMTAFGPATAAYTVRLQSRVVKDGFHMTLTDDWLAVIYPLAEARYRWAGIDNVIETPEAWYMMFGRAQPFTIPKSAMSDAQRAQFAAFLTAERQRQAGRAFLGPPR